MIHTLAFTKWFIHKHSASGIIVDGKDLDFILSQLDQNSWEEFTATADSIAISKITAETLIPQLVEKMPKKPRAKKGNDQGKKIISNNNNDDAQLPTDGGDVVPKKRAPKAAKSIQEPVEGEGMVVVEGEGMVVVEKKEPKKRAPKNSLQEVVDKDPNQDGEIVVEKKEPKKRAPKKSVQEVVVEKKEPKKRAPKKSVQEVVVEDGEVVEEKVDQQQSNEVVVEKKEPKKRVPKAAKKIDQESVVDKDPTEDGEVVVEKKEPKKRAPKAAKSIQEPVEGEGEGVVVEKKEPKKRAPKASKKSIQELVEGEEGEIIEEKIGSEKNKKKSTIVPDDVVIPMKEQDSLGSDLQEDIYQEDIELDLQEVFIDETLYYRDVDNNWFNASLIPIADPTTI